MEEEEDGSVSGDIVMTGLTDLSVNPYFQDSVSAAQTASNVGSESQSRVRLASSGNSSVVRRPIERDQSLAPWSQWQGKLNPSRAKTSKTVKESAVVRVDREEEEEEEEKAGGGEENLLLTKLHPPVRKLVLQFLLELKLRAFGSERILEQVREFFFLFFLKKKKKKKKSGVSKTSFLSLLSENVAGISSCRV